MRALLLLALLAPLAAAQGEPVDWIQAEVAPFPGAVTPLKAPISTVMTTRVSCALADPVTQSVVLQYLVTSKPEWSTVIVSPATDVAPLGECAGGYAAPREATLTVTANDQAPAFVPGEIVLEIQASDGPREQVERASVSLSAGYFAILDVQMSEARVVIPPGGAHDFRITLTNFGNGPTRVEPVLTDAAAHLQFELPPVIILGSKQQGAADVSSEVLLRVSAPPESGFVNRVGTGSVLFLASYAPDPSEGSDEGQLAVLVTVRSGADGGSDDSRLPLPHPGVLALVGLAVVAAMRPRTKA